MKVGVKTNEIVPENATKPEGAIDDASNYYTAEGRIEIATVQGKKQELEKLMKTIILVHLLFWWRELP